MKQNGKICKLATVRMKHDNFYQSLKAPRGGASSGIRRRVPVSIATYLSPSLACCPLERLEAHVRELEELGADMLHVDIMDGDFVANYCLGTEFVPLLHRITRLPLDVHLMVQRPEQKM